MKCYVSIQGQSNTLGVGGNPVLAVDQGHLRTGATSFESLEPEGNYELVEQRLAEHLGELTGCQVIVDTNGISNTSITALSKGSTNYQNALDDRNRALLFAASAGFALTDYGMCWIQGERDEKDGMDLDTYRDLLVQLALDWYNDTGTGMHIIQLCNWTQVGGAAYDIVEPTIVLAQYQAAIISPHITVSHPSYTSPHFNGGANVHFSNSGHYLNGERLAKALANSNWAPLQPDGASIINDRVYVELSEPFEFDVSGFPAKPNYGFTVSDDNGSVPVALAQRISQSVELRLDRALVGTVRVQYGLATVDDALCGPVDVDSPGGNVRTTDDRWLLAFDIEVL